MDKNTTQQNASRTLTTPSIPSGGPRSQNERAFLCSRREDEALASGQGAGVGGRLITKIILHCSATMEGNDYTAEDIRRWHVDGNGWSDIGYHYVIRRDGTIEFGRPIDKVGSHTLGQNQNSIGICYVGGVDRNLRPKDTRTEAQKCAICDLLRVLLRMFPEATIHGHNEFDKGKSCPCFDAKREYSDLCRSLK